MMNDWPSPVFLILFFISAAAGGICRVWVSNRVARVFGVQFPYGTLLVNSSGAFLLGLLAALLAITSVPATPDAWLWLGVGFLGSYTTVSTFSLQTLSLLQGHQLKAALLNTVLSVGLSLLAISAGFYLGLLL